MNSGQLTIHSSYIAEKQKLNSAFDAGESDNLSNNLDVFKIDASLFLNPGINFTLGYFDVTGSKDAGLWGGDFAGNVPNNNGVRAQLVICHGKTQNSQCNM